MNSPAALAADRREEALAKFTEYFEMNYPGPETIIHDPRWHAPKIFRAAEHALAAVSRSVVTPERSDDLRELVLALADLAEEEDDTTDDTKFERRCARIRDLAKKVRAAGPGIDCEELAWALRALAETKDGPRSADCMPGYRVDAQTVLATLRGR